VADEIRARGHEADTVFDERLSGRPDPEVLAAAAKGKRVLLTMDKGIADVRGHPPADFRGIVLLRPKRTGRVATIQFVRRHLSVLLETELAGRFVVVSEASIRIR
jgi:hypothetical protein